VRSLRLLRNALRPPSSRHRYGPHRCHRADLHLPAGTGPHPVAILIHGGSWRARYDRRMMRGLAHDLNGRGWAAWNVEYRRIGRGQGGGWPATLEDVAAGIDHLAGVEAPLDLSRVICIGFSAGGQLALWAAARPGLPDGAPGASPRLRIDRVASQAGVCDMAGAARVDSEAAVVDFLGGEPGDVPERYAVADPIERVPLGIDTLLVHGQIDATVSVERSRAYARAARMAGDQVELVELRHADHRAHLDTRSAAWAAVVHWLGRG
jgi:acetyl esterase/lipase